jgi:hypothetical protein
MVGENGGAVRGADARRVEQVLDREPDPVVRLELGDEDGL